MRHCLQLVLYSVECMSLRCKQFTCWTSSAFYCCSRLLFLDKCCIRVLTDFRKFTSVSNKHYTKTAIYFCEKTLLDNDKNKPTL